MSAATKTLSWTQVIQWIKKGGWSLADQWIFSGANVIANILLARWLSVEDYGIFAIVFSTFLFTVAIHTALIIEPMLVLGAGRLRDWRRPYFKFLFASHAAVSVIGTVLLALFSLTLFAFASREMAASVLVAALGLPLLLLPWFSRRAYYLQARSDWATLCSVLYLLSLVGAILLLQSLGILSPSWAFGAFILASATTALPMFFFFDKLPEVTDPPPFRSMLTIQWDYAKWSGPASVLLWVPLNIFFFALPYSAGGLEATATLKAFGNILNPLSQSNQALIALLLPQLSLAFTTGGSKVLGSISRKITYVFLAASAAFWLALAILRRPLLELLYGNTYTQRADLLLIAGVIPILMGLTAILATELRSSEQPKLVFVGYLVGALIATFFGILLTLASGLIGALIGQIGAYFGMILTFAWLIRRQ